MPLFELQEEKYFNWKYVILMYFIEDIAENMKLRNH